MAEIVHTDVLGRNFCASCWVVQPLPREVILASWAAANCPYDVGDKVECRTGGQVYDGVGTIVEKSTDPKDLATPLVPMFRVAIEDKAYPEMPDEAWYSEVCITKVDA